MKSTEIKEKLGQVCRVDHFNDRLDLGMAIDSINIGNGQPGTVYSKKCAFVAKELHCTNCA